MPSIAQTTELLAHINFPLPEAELENAEQYKWTFSSKNPVPSRVETVPLYDLRPALACDSLASAGEQLDSAGFAAIKHTSKYSTQETLAEVAGTEAYLEETCELVRSLLGASRVLPWNSVLRVAGTQDRNHEQKQQQGLEKGRAAANNVQPTAGSAHVDQDVPYAQTIIRRALQDEEGDPFEKYTRLQIINLWRPLHGPVTNKPLAVCDFRTIDTAKNVMITAGSFGGAYGVSYSPEQRWHYIQHQMPDEGLLLRCYDSNQGRNGEALYTGHLAIDVLNEAEPEGLEGLPLVPRASCEVRLVVLHE